MRTVFTAAAFSLMLTASAAFTEEGQNLPRLLPRDREIALAVSAGPLHIVQRATVYVLERGGYVKVREGANGFTCLVVRDHPEDLAPICHDPEGSRTVLPRLLREAELRAQGKTEQEVRREIDEGLRTGKYRWPQRAGVAYMLSTEAKAFVPSLGRSQSLQPHVMLYAPYLRNEDIGAREPKQGEPGYPFVISEGEFNAYIVMEVPDSDQPAPPVQPDPVIDRASAGAASPVPPLLPRDRELALALSAAPPHIAERVAVLVLEKDGYVEARKGTNGFTCLVERDYSPQSLYPICYDAEGTLTMLPVSLRMAELQWQGKKNEEIDREIAEGFRTGRFRAPRRAGVAYMFSTEGRFPVPTGGGVTGWAPHAMFYAPYLRRADIGALEEGQLVRRLPTLLNEGSPHAYIVVNLKRESEKAKPSPESE